MFDEFKMNGQQRGYRQAGKKIMCRDASLFQYGKNNAERRARLGAELAHVAKMEREYLESVGAQPFQTEQRVAKTREALSTRRAKYVERFFQNMVENDDRDVYYQAAFQSLGNAQWRYFSALDDDFCARMAGEADEQLLAYARG